MRRKIVLCCILSILMLALIGNTTYASGTISLESIEKAISFAYNKKDTAPNDYDGKCAAFVWQAYNYGAGIGNPSFATARQMGDALITNTDSNPPRGAFVFWYDSYGPTTLAGHVGLSLGDGTVIHAYPNIVVSKISTVNNSHYIYRGWGAPITGYALATADTEAPTVSNLNVTNISGSSFTVNCTLNDNVGVTRVWLNIYGPCGSDGYEVSASNGSFSHTIYTANYGGNGVYAVHIYAFDAVDNGSGMHAINEIYIINPEQVNLYIDKYVAAVNEDVMFSYDAKYTNRFWLQIFKDNVPMYSLNLGNSEKHTMRFQEKGDYAAYISGSNELGYADSQWLYFTICDEKPSGANLSVNKATASINESVLFSFYAKYANKYWLQIFKDNKQVYSLNLGGSFQHEMSFAEEGSYSAYISCSNGLGYVDSDWIHFYITNEKPKNAELTIDKTQVKSNEMVNFIYHAELANQYWLQIFKDDSQIYSINLGSENQHEMSFTEEGNYSAYVSCSNGLGYIDSKWVYFSVSNSLRMIPYTQSTIMQIGTIHAIKTSVYNVDTSCTVLAAGYKGDKLIALASKEYNQEDLSFALDGDFDTIKVMTWDSGKSMQNLCDTEVIPSSKWTVE